jgi:hypothetical protein
MEKNPLIGVSISAVILLILASLTNVVGYQSVKSSAITESPLFHLRSQKATQQQPNRIISEYLGKGKENTLFISLKDRKTDFLRKCIMQIKTMDDTEIDCLKNMLISDLGRRGEMPDVKPQVILAALCAIRDDPAVLSYLDNDFKSNDNLTNLPTNMPTYNCLCSVLAWTPGCFAKNMVNFILFLILAPFLVPLILLVWATAYLLSISGH